MAFDTVVDKAQLEDAITASANAIRRKTGDDAKIQWDSDKGFENAIDSIETGGVTLPELSDPGSAADLASGKQLIDADGNVVTGTLETKGSVMVSSGGVMSDYDADEFKISGTISSYGLPAIIKSGATASIYTYKSAYGNATVDDVAAGKTFTSENGVKLTGNMSTSSSGKTLVTKDGSTSTATFDTGLSEIVTVMLYRNSVTSAGLVSATVVPPLGYINYGGCSSYSTYVKNYTTACSPAVGTYCTIDGGTVNWISTSTVTAFQEGTSYIWRAIGYE